ncbi:hypothetical protein L484_009699 [Morus notabilis]|uniref:Uncharacterized protein n=1 Tax=Morus notabilis TaxID=981085 RepID=W9SUI9_9ROSA|nr:hypothetical protein L484_009699 [Morus notabilis]
MSKLNPKFASFGFVPRESAMAGPGTLPHRSPFHRSTDPVDRSPVHRPTGGVILLCHRSTGSH